MMRRNQGCHPKRMRRILGPKTKILRRYAPQNDRKILRRTFILIHQQNLLKISLQTLVHRLILYYLILFI